MRLNRFYFDQAISIDNALSTNHILHQLIHQINKIIDTINEFETDAHAYTDLKVGELRVELNNEVERLENLIDTRETILRDLIYEKSTDAENNAKLYTDEEIEVLKTDYIQPKIEEIYNTIRLIENRLDAKIDGVNTRLTNLIEETKAELIDLIKKGGAIYSAVSGRLTNPETVEKEITHILQLKNGVTWADISNLMYTQYFGADKDVYLPQFPPTEIEGVKISSTKISAYNTNPTIMRDNETTPTKYYMYVGSFGLNAEVVSITINGIPTILSYVYTSESMPKNALYLPIATVQNDNILLKFRGWDYMQYDFKRCNIIEVKDNQGNTYVFSLLIPNAQELSVPTYDDIIASCTSNKKYNTWDSLTYYTVEFLNEHLTNGDYNIPINSGYEKLGTGNTINATKSFYHNRT